MKQSTAQSLLKHNKEVISNMEKDLKEAQTITSDLWNNCEKGVSSQLDFDTLNYFKKVVRDHKKSIAQAAELSKFLKSYTRRYYGK